MSKGKGISRTEVYKQCQRNKHRSNICYQNYLKLLTKIQLHKLKLLCRKLDVSPYELREKEFKMISTNKKVIKLFKRANKHKQLYDSFKLVLERPM